MAWAVLSVACIGFGAALFRADASAGSLVGYVGLVVSAATFGWGLWLRRAGRTWFAYAFMLGGLVATAGSLIEANPVYTLGSVGCWFGYVGGVVCGGWVVGPVGSKTGVRL